MHSLLWDLPVRATGFARRQTFSDDAFREDVAVPETARPYAMPREYETRQEEQTSMRGDVKGHDKVGDELGLARYDGANASRVGLWPPVDLN